MTLARIEDLARRRVDDELVPVRPKIAPVTAGRMDTRGLMERIVARRRAS